MKRLVLIGLSILMMTTAFVGCNAGKKTASTVSDAASDVVSGADKVVSDAGDGLKSAGSAIDENADKMKNNGQVSDGDGFIGNEGQTVEQKVENDTTEAATE